MVIGRDTGFRAATMSISGQERQVLDSMESELARSDPRLASMLVMFSRLTADERMPARKPVSSGAGPRRILRLRVGRQARGWLLLVTAAALFVSMVTLNHVNRVSPCAYSLTTCEQTHARSVQFAAH